MTPENVGLGQNASVYYLIETSPTELVLQPQCSRSQAMRRAWLSIVTLEVFLLPMVILPTALMTIFILMTLSFTAPGLQNHWMTKLVIALLWGLGLAAIAFFTGKAVWISGYTTFIFDRVQNQFVIHTINLLGQKLSRKISFNQIQDGVFREYESDGISIDICLFLEKRKVLGFPYQETIVLSSFSSEERQSVTNLTALKHHKETLERVRKTLEL